MIKAFCRLPLHWQILAALAAALTVGLLLPKDTTLWGISFYGMFDFMGTLFLQALKMVVVPLVVSSIICGVYGLGSGGNVGRMTVKTLSFYFASTFLAICVGLVLVNITEPGIVGGEPAREQLNLSSPEELGGALDEVSGRDASDITSVFLRMIPTNIVAAAADSNQLLGVIIFGILFGIFMNKAAPKSREVLANFWQGVFDVMMHITLFVMKFAPLGVFGLVAKTAMATGLSSFVPLAVFFLTVVAALTIHTFGTLALMLKVIGGVSPVAHYRAMFPAMLTAFSTASSSATLPVTMECLHKNAGVSTKTTSFVVPLGATVNMDGTALYECVAAMFIAQAYGLDLSFAQQFLIVIMALLTSVGVAGIPSASLVAIAIILGAIGLPLEGIGLLLVTDRVLDMLRTAVNVFSDTCCAVVVAKTEGEQGILEGVPSATMSPPERS